MKEYQQIFTDLIITPKTNKNLKRYFESLKRHLPKPWKIEKTDYEDVNTFRILHETVCIKSFAFEDKLLKKLLSTKLFLGLTSSDIRLLKFEIDTEVEVEHKIEIIGFVLYSFHLTVLKTSKYYNYFNHNFLFGGPTDENWICTDIRDSRTIKLFSEKEKVTYSLSKTETINIDKSQISYTAPNSISLSLSLMKKSLKKSKKLHSKLIPINLKTLNKIDINLKDELYDFFEEMQTSIIFSYIAVEAFANAAIPDEFEYEKHNEKGVKEIWNKTSIERWLSTSEKVSVILPKILNSTDIKQENFWSSFKNLEKLRNEIVHQKTIENDTALNTKIYSEMLNPITFTIIESAINVIDFFYKLNNAHPYFPLGLGIAKFQVARIECMEKHFVIKND